MPALRKHTLGEGFEAINKVTFEEDLAMTTMFSGEGEEVAWDGKVYPEGNVEFWLTDVETMMRASINTIMGKSVASYAVTDRKQWVIVRIEQVRVVEEIVLVELLSWQELLQACKITGTCKTELAHRLRDVRELLATSMYPIHLDRIHSDSEADGVDWTAV